LSFGAVLVRKFLKTSRPTWCSHEAKSRWLVSRCS
jgi:hypothetical protein